jgi:hypothetical protein
MATTSSQNNGEGIVRYASGSFLDDAASPADLEIELGWAPRYFRWINVTDRDEWEWFEGAANGTCLKTVAAGTRTLDTSDAAIAVSGSTVTIESTAGIEQNKQYRWIALG